MEDSRIIDLYWARSEQAIAESSRKYGSYCFRIAYGILMSREDAEESVSDTWLGAWNCMPPQRPNLLSAFFGKITRSSAIDRWRRNNAGRRGGGELPLALDELADCIPGGRNTEQEAEAMALADAVRTFLDGLPDTERRVFLCRYWYLDPIESIGRRFGFRKSRVTTMLYRTRLKLRQHLEQEGFL